MSTGGKCLIKIAGESSVQDALHQSTLGAPDPTDISTSKDDQSSLTQQAGEHQTLDASSDTDSGKDGGLSEQELVGVSGTEQANDLVEGGGVEVKRDTDEQELSRAIDHVSVSDVNSKPRESDVVQYQTDTDKQNVSHPDVKFQPSDEEELRGSGEEESGCCDDLECSEHPKDKASAYCDTCDKKICLRCIIGAHRHHEFITLEDKIEGQQKKMSESLKAVRDLKSIVVIAKTEQEAAKLKLSEAAVALRDEVLKGKEKLLKNLECKYEKGVGKLTEHFSAQKELVETLSAEKLQSIDGLLERETASSDTRLKKCMHALETAESLTTTSMDAGSHKSLTKIRSITNAAMKSAEDLETAKKTLEASPALPADDNTDIEELGDLHAKVVNGKTQEAESQTDITSNQLEAYRKQIKYLTKKSTQDLFDTQMNGHVALSTDSRDACRNYGAGLRNSPFPLQAPDVSEPLSWDAPDSDVVFVTEGETKALALLVGGGSYVTIEYSYGSAALIKSKKPVSLYVFLVDKREYSTAVDSKNESALFGHRYFLPIDENMKDLLLNLMFYSDEPIFTAWSNGEVISEHLTVREWGKKYPSYTVLFEEQ